MVIFNANYRLVKGGVRQTVPAPVDADTPDVPWWWDKVASLAPGLRRAGYTAVLLPPFSKTQSGSFPTGDGYGKFDDYDLGSKRQMNSLETRFGSRERLQRAVAVCHACGLDVHGDVVLHQYDGGRNGTYRYASATGRDNGRFPKFPPCFVGPPPRVPVDPVWNMEGNFAFGDMVSIVNSQPPDYMAQGLIDAADWLVRSTGIDGLRVDDVKGMYAPFIHRFLTSKSLGRLWAFSELFDGNPDELGRWVWSDALRGRSSVLDFTLHWALQAMCDWQGSMRRMNGAGYTSRDPFHSVTFVDSPDTDTSPGQQISSNKLLAYAFLLTAEGVPTVYYRDWAEEPYCYGLRRWIDNLVWIHELLAHGRTETRYLDDHIIVLNRLGPPGLLTAISNDPWNPRTVACSTGWGPWQRLHDYTGHHRDILTDHYGRVIFTVPPNSYGRGQSYLCFGPPEFQGRDVPVVGRPTTQVFEGAEDLDLPPLPVLETAEVGRIWCEAHSAIKLAVLDPPDLAASVNFYLVGPDGQRLWQNQQDGVWEAQVRGWQTVMARSSLPTMMPYRLGLTYTAPPGL